MGSPFSVCLCLASGALTPGSLTTIGGIISANGTGVNRLTSLTNGAIGYTASSLLNYITSAEPPIVRHIDHTPQRPAVPLLTGHSLGR